MATDGQQESGDILERVITVLSGWEGVTHGPHRFGGVEFRVAGREMGHMHGSRLADLPFPMGVRNQLVADGKASPHHVMPNSGWVSFWISAESDLDAVVSLFQMQYDRLRRTSIAR